MKRTKKPRRSASRLSVRPGRGYELRSPKGKMYWKVDVLKNFGSKEHYAVVRIRPAP